MESRVPEVLFADFLGNKTEYVTRVNKEKTESLSAKLCTLLARNPKYPYGEIFNDAYMRLLGACNISIGKVYST